MAGLGLAEEERRGKSTPYRLHRFQKKVVRIGNTTDLPFLVFRLPFPRCVHRPRAVRDASAPPLLNNELSNLPE